MRYQLSYCSLAITFLCVIQISQCFVQYMFVSQRQISPGCGFTALVLVKDNINLVLRNTSSWRRLCGHQNVFLSFMFDETFLVKIIMVHILLTTMKTNKMVSVSRLAYTISFGRLSPLVYLAWKRHLSHQPNGYLEMSWLRELDKRHSHILHYCIFTSRVKVFHISSRCLSDFNKSYWFC